MNRKQLKYIKGLLELDRTYSAGASEQRAEIDVMISNINDLISETQTLPSFSLLDIMGD